MIPEDLKYTKDHEWVRIETNEATVGITAHAAEQLGDITYIELPAEGKILKQGDVLGSIESVKTVSDIYCPISGTVTHINPKIRQEDFSVLTEDIYQAGWLVKLGSITMSDTNALLSSEEYTALLQ